MTPIMHQTNEYIIGISDDLTKIQLRNPFVMPGEPDNDGRFKALRMMVEGALQKANAATKAENEAAAATTVVTQTLTPDFRSSQVYADLLEMKQKHEGWLELLKKNGMEPNGSDATAVMHSAVCMVIGMIEREAERGAKKIVEA